MNHVAMTPTDGSRVFRLAYASRAVAEMPHPAVVQMTNEAAASNTQSHVSGVLFSGHGVFLQWLEGSAEDVCGLMSRISADERHTDVTVLGAGSISARRFPRWPMQLSDAPFARPKLDHLSGETPYDAATAMTVFDLAEERYQRDADIASHDDRGDLGLTADLMQDDPGQGFDPMALVGRDLRSRAHIVDAVFKTLRRGWQDDVWSSAEIAMGIMRLNTLWQCAGRMPDPIGARQQVVVVVPPGSAEVLGAIVKADLLRSAGFNVDTVLEANADDAFSAISHSDPQSIVVAGPRFGFGDDTARAARFAEQIRSEFPDHAVHLGGHIAGPLTDWPNRLSARGDARSESDGSDFDWLVLHALQNIKKRSSLPPRIRASKHGTLLN